MKDDTTDKKRNILARLWHPETPKDEILIRIFFWASIILCLIISRVFENFATTQKGQAIVFAMGAAAIFIRFSIYFRR